MIITDADLEWGYERKKESCEKRLIGFELTLADYKALFRARGNLKCFYTDAEFNLKSTESDNYPTLDRINSSKPYCRGNVVFCTKLTNDLKGRFIENDFSRKGIGTTNSFILGRITKVLEQPNIMEERYGVYEDLFNKVDERLQEIQQRVDLVEIKEEQKTKEILRQETLEKYEYEQNLAKEFNSWWGFFKELDCVFALTFKEFRDVMRAKSCRISKKEFTSWGQRSFFVLDKTKTIIEKDNIVLCDKTVQECLDRMGGVDLELLHTVGKSLIKLGE
jgi:hypothetical protein